MLVGGASACVQEHLHLAGLLVDRRVEPYRLIQRPVRDLRTLGAVRLSRYQRMLTIHDSSGCAISPEYDHWVNIGAVDKALHREPFLKCIRSCGRAFHLLKDELKVILCQIRVTLRRVRIPQGHKSVATQYDRRTRKRFRHGGRAGRGSCRGLGPVGQGIGLCFSISLEN